MDTRTRPDSGSRPTRIRAAAGPAAAAACLLVAADAFAGADATTPSLEPGTRVRVEAPGLARSRVVGTVRSLDGESLEFVADGSHEPVRIARERISRLESSHGHGSRLVDALIGGLAGGAVGALVGKASTSKSGYMESAAEAGAAILGALLGTTIGAVSPPGERWQDVPASRYRVSLAPRLDGQIGVKFAVAF
jgi:hypothetical protein